MNLFTRASLSLSFLQLFFLCGCFTYGPKISEFGPARTLNGVITTLDLSTTALKSLQGELLAIDDSGLLVLIPSSETLQGRVTRVPYASINKATFDRLPHLTITSRSVPDENKREQLRLMSRFPEGTDSAGFQKLLASLEQTEIDEFP